MNDDEQPPVPFINRPVEEAANAYDVLAAEMNTNMRIENPALDVNAARMFAQLKNLAIEIVTTRAKNATPISLQRTIGPEGAATNHFIAATDAMVDAAAHLVAALHYVRQTDSRQVATLWTGIMAQVAGSIVAVAKYAHLIELGRIKP